MSHSPKPSTDAARWLWNESCRSSPSVPTAGRAALRAWLGRLAPAAAALELAALGVLAHPYDLAVDARVGRCALLPHGLRVEARLLGAGDLPQSQPQLVRGGVAPVPEAAPAPV